MTARRLPWDTLTVDSEYERIEIKQAAIDAVAAGIAIMPPRENGSKAPDTHEWVSRQTVMTTAEDVNNWYLRDRTGVGWITGKVSGNLEVIDFDDRSAYHDFRRAAIDIGLKDLVDRIESGYLEYTPNGVHWPYRCTKIAGNTKLAQRQVSPTERKALIETRGEGGYIITAPTHGAVNADGSYILKRGGVRTITSISPEEREELHNLARTFDQCPDPIAPFDSRPDARAISGEERPGDEFNRMSAWDEVLCPHGWECIKTVRGVRYWRRPGKTSGGHSATTGYGGGDFFVNFSSSVADFEIERGYSKFRVFAILTHGGDFVAASKDLRERGFGGQSEEPDSAVDISGIVESFGSSDRPRAESVEGSFPAHLLNVPGAVGDFAKWLDQTSIHKQPILSLGAAIAAWGVLAGRKFEGSTGLRTNNYIINVAPSGVGKERARRGIKDLFASIGAPELCAVESLASDSGLETAVAATPSMLLLIDEAGMFIGSVTDRNASKFSADIKPSLMKLYSSARSVYAGKSRADNRKDVTIDQPCVSMLGTTTPDLFLSKLSSTEVHDGFMSRLLIFETESPNPKPDRVSLSVEKNIPDNIRAQASMLLRLPLNGSSELIASATPEPRLVPCTPDADELFHDLDMRVWQECEDGIKNGIRVEALRRIGENARKLALTVACGSHCKPRDFVVTSSIAAWAIELSEWLTRRLIRLAEEHGAENVVEADRKRLAQVIRSTRKWTTKSEITRRTQWMRKRDRDDALEDLVTAGLIDMRQSQGSAGRIKTEYRIY